MKKNFINFFNQAEKVHNAECSYKKNEMGLMWWLDVRSIWDTILYEVERSLTWWKIIIRYHYLMKDHHKISLLNEFFKKLKDHYKISKLDERSIWDKKNLMKLIMVFNQGENHSAESGVQPLERLMPLGITRGFNSLSLWTPSNITLIIMVRGF